MTKDANLPVIFNPDVLPHDSPLNTLTYLQPSLIPLRDGEVIIFRRADSPYWQCRFKRHDKWERFSTKQASIERAVEVACLAYDEARFRHKLGLARKAPAFTEIARATLYELRCDLDAGIGKSVYATYIMCIEKYFLPCFADTRLEDICPIVNTPYYHN